MNRRLFLLFLPGLIAGCTYIPGGNPCAKFVPLASANRPIVCIDDRNLNHLTSSPYEAWARKSAPIKWFTASGEGGLEVVFDDEKCVKKETVDCRSGSKCEAKINADTAKDTRCKYSVRLTRNSQTTTEDPIVIIDDGVYNPEEKP